MCNTRVSRAGAGARLLTGRYMCVCVCVCVGASPDPSPNPLTTIGIQKFIKLPSPRSKQSCIQVGARIGDPGQSGGRVGIGERASARVAVKISAMVRGRVRVPNSGDN